jgi:hypothetical protein
MGEGAGGVSTHSKFSSEVLLLILHLADEFCKTQSKGVESFGWRAVSFKRKLRQGELVLLQLSSEHLILHLEITACESQRARSYHPELGNAGSRRSKILRKLFFDTTSNC